MEMTAIIVVLLAVAGGLAVLASSGLHWVAVHRQGLLAAGGPGGLTALVLRARSRLRPGWVFGVSAVAGLAVITSAAAGAGKMVEELTAGDGMGLLDHPVAAFVAAHRDSALTMVMRGVSSAGNPLVVTILAAASGLLLGITRRSWEPVLVAGVTLAGTGALTLVLKAALGRPRPPLGDAVAAADGYAFPSGHAATAAAAFGVLAYLISVRLRQQGARAAVWAAAAVLTVLVGVSRVYLGVHWTTDVLGGWAFGILWLAVIGGTWTVVTRYGSALAHR